MTTLTGNERFIEAGTGNYPLSFEDIRRLLPHVLFGSNVTEEEMKGLGFFVVALEDHVEADVATEGQPVLVGDSYKQVWVTRDFTSEERESQLNILKAELSNKVGELVVAALSYGVPHEFSEDSGTQHIQIRDGDRANLTGMHLTALGNPDIIQEFRSRENNNFSLSAADIISLTNAAQVGYLKYLRQAWALKDAIEIATSPEELPELPYNLNPI